MNSATVTRRWAITVTTPTNPRPLILATYWTHHAAHRNCLRLTTSREETARRTLNPHAARYDYNVTPMDHAPYTHRAAAITTTLDRGPRSVPGIAARTTMSDHTIGQTLLRMAREHRVLHVIPGDDTGEPRLGVWRLLTIQERATRT